MDLNELKTEAYETAKAHGWHDKEHSDEHEEWKDIHGYEGLYQISDMGRVRSLDRIVLLSRKIKNGRRIYLEIVSVKMKYNLLRPYMHGGRKY